MTEPFFDETKLPEAMQIISDADSLMTEKDCENDEAAKKELEELQNKLREITGKPQILIRDFWRYDEATDLETTAKSALMCTPEKEEMTREELIELTEAVVTMYDKNTKRIYGEAEYDFLVTKFEKNINHPGGTDLIFYPELVGLPDNASVYEIVDLAMRGESEKINEEIKNNTHESEETFISRMNKMSQKLTREELIELTEAVMTEYDKYTKKNLEDDEVDAVKAKFIKSINHPGGIDLIEDPESFGLPSSPSVYEIVDLAMKGIPEKDFRKK